MSGLLSGVRVLDLTRMLAGPYATLLLSDFGAEVIKIEETEKGDEIRGMGPPFVNGQSPYFIAVNRGKKSLTLNLKTQEGRELFYRLVQKSDAVIDNFRPGILEKLKCDYGILANLNPGIISCSITSFGEEGPLSQLPAFDLAIQAYSGAMSITGEPGHPPVRLGIPLGDLSGGMFGALAICAALNRRHVTGKGERISISLLDSLTSMLSYVAQYYLADGKVPGPQGSGHVSVVPYGAFKTKDIYIIVAVFTEKFWIGFCDAIGQVELADDPRFNKNALRVENRKTLEPILEEIFLQQAGKQWLERLEQKGIPCAPVNTVDETLSMEQLLRRNMLVSIDQSGIGEMTVLGSPIRVEGSRNLYGPAPMLGEHTVEILSSLLQMDNDKINDLKHRGII
jgi:crotonobetainyl-CoA:carnitine CoA-transferase CaiB-like acyl-CoA transferase